MYIYRKILLLVLGLLPFAFSGCWIMDYNAEMANKLVPSTDKNREVLIDEAKALVIQKRKMYSDLEWAKGPCLGKLNDEWVVDIAHKPRLPVDDDPANQCADFASGEVKHFIEMTEDGTVIKTF